MWFRNSAVRNSCVQTSVEFTRERKRVWKKWCARKHTWRGDWRFKIVKWWIRIGWPSKKMAEFVLFFVSWILKCLRIELKTFKNWESCCCRNFFMDLNLWYIASASRGVLCLAWLEASCSWYYLDKSMPECYMERSECMADSNDVSLLIFLI